MGILNAGRNPPTDDLSSIVDIERSHQLQTRVRGNQGVQVDHGTAVLPQKRVRKSRGWDTKLGTADDLTLGSNRCCVTVAAERSKICHHSPPPNKPMVDGAARQIRLAHRVPSIVDPIGGPRIASQCAHVRKHTSVPKKGMECRVSCQIRLADDLTSVVHTLRSTERTPEATEVRHGAVIPQEWVHSWDPGGGVWRRVRIRSTSYQSIGFISPAATIPDGVGPTQSPKIL